MREILFRGKTKAIAGSPYNNGKPDGEWIKGYLYNDVGCWKIGQFETDYADYIPYEVDPETVGQYTGLKDKNGKRIFEGDIVIDKYSCEKFGFVGAVKYNDKLTKFRIESDKYPDYDIGLGSRRDSIRILGNIHDNPELLKGE